MNKSEILKIVHLKLSEKIDNLEFLIAETRAANNETKSSMGDKYETSREMVQQEINTLQLQLNENLKAKNFLKFINTNPHQIVGLGSLVETDKGLFYIAVSFGIIDMAQRKIFLISPESPVAQAMAGKSQGDEFSLNSTRQKIIKIW
ncbi:GreA/GreB family elongation factor [Kaistella palustris]|uniref:GreA/GreB family elongation factor n=1 Tax=Kaistella palustris TaxID=493376 RepID=UPI0004215ABB|nr:GreA/GreB family elongation factor [Kaistella palustris]